MILGIKTLLFVLLILCALLAGALGAAVMLNVQKRFVLKENHKESMASRGHIARRAKRQGAASGWQRMTRDEQLYNGH